MNINEKIKSLRKSRNMTQAEVATALEIKLSTYQKYEKTSNPLNPGIDVIIKISNFYNVSTDYLLGRESETASTPIDDLTKQFNLSELEKTIIKNYTNLPKDTRINIMEFLEKSVKEVQGELVPEEDASISKEIISDIEKIMTHTSIK